MTNTTEQNLKEICEIREELPSQERPANESSDLSSHEPPLLAPTRRHIQQYRSEIIDGVREVLDFESEHKLHDMRRAVLIDTLTANLEGRALMRPAVYSKLGISKEEFTEVRRSLEQWLFQTLYRSSESTVSVKSFRTRVASRRVPNTAMHLQYDPSEFINATPTLSAENISNRDAVAIGYLLDKASSSIGTPVREAVFSTMKKLALRKQSSVVNLNYICRVLFDSGISVSKVQMSDLLDRLLIDHEALFDELGLVFLEEGKERKIQPMLKTPLIDSPDLHRKLFETCENPREVLKQRVLNSVPHLTGMNKRDPGLVKSIFGTIFAKMRTGGGATFEDIQNKASEDGYELTYHMLWALLKVVESLNEKIPSLLGFTIVGRNNFSFELTDAEHVPALGAYNPKHEDDLSLYPRPHICNFDISNFEMSINGSCEKEKITVSPQERMVLQTLASFSKANFTVTCPIILKQMQEKFGVTIKVSRLHRIFTNLRRYFAANPHLCIKLESNDGNGYYLRSVRFETSSPLFASWSNYMDYVKENNVSLKLDPSDTSDYQLYCRRGFTEDGCPVLLPIKKLLSAENSLPEDLTEIEFDHYGRKYDGLIDLLFNIVDASSEGYEHYANSFDFFDPDEEILIALNGDVNRISKVSKRFIVPV